MPTTKTALVISEHATDLVWDTRRRAIDCMQTQVHLRAYCSRPSVNRGNCFRRNFSGMADRCPALCAEAFETVFPRAVDELDKRRTKPLS